MTTELGADLSQQTKDNQPRTEVERRMTNGEVFDRVEELMHDKSFLVEVAYEADRAYRESEIDRLTRAGQPIEDWLSTPLFSDTERTILISGATEGDVGQTEIQAKAQQKLAMGLGGFYAVSEGVGIAAESNPSNPNQAHDTLIAVVSGTETQRDRSVMSRLAHATWAAAQPFRGRETRPVMKPFDKLPLEEQHKDMVQIRASAATLAASLTSSSTPLVK
jgi:hypothetical protein